MARLIGRALRFLRHSRHQLPRIALPGSAAPVGTRDSPYTRPSIDPTLICPVCRGVSSSANFALGGKRPRLRLRPIRPIFGEYYGDPGTSIRSPRCSSRKIRASGGRRCRPAERDQMVHDLASAEQRFNYPRLRRSRTVSRHKASRITHVPLLQETPLASWLQRQHHTGRQRVGVVVHSPSGHQC